MSDILNTCVNMRMHACMYMYEHMDVWMRIACVLYTDMIVFIAVVTCMCIVAKHACVFVYDCVNVCSVVRMPDQADSWTDRHVSVRTRVHRTCGRTPVHTPAHHAPSRKILARGAPGCSSRRAGSCWASAPARGCLAL